MKKINLRLSVSALAFAFVALGASRAGAQTLPLLPGDLVVTVYGKANTAATNNTYLDGDATPISLQQFSPTISAGIDNTTPALTETLPTTGTGNNVGIVGEYGSSSEGTIQVSGNGQYITLGGYDGNLDEVGGPYGNTNNGTAEAQSTSSSVPRVAAVINIATGNVDTSTVLNIYNTNNPRSIYSTDGSTLYLSGQGASKSDQGGLYLTSTGTQSTVPNGATPIFNQVSTRTVTGFNVNASTGTASTTNLYYSADQNSSKGVQTGIFQYTGLPAGSQGTNTGVRLTLASGVVNGVTVNFSPQGFFFANATTLYVADTGSPKAGGNADGGIQKWSYVAAGQVWQLDYTLTYNFSTSSSETGFSSLAGSVVNGVVDLYATSYTAADDAPDGLYGVADTLSSTTAPAGEAVVQLAASSPDSDFKGVAIVPAAAPEPSTNALLILAALGSAAFAWKRKKA
jgi:PEP-CTERM motif